MWKLYVDGSSNQKGCSAGVVLESPSGVRLKQSLRFAIKASNNQAEYKALIAGLLLAMDIGVKHLIFLSDSQLTVRQVNDNFQVNDSLLTTYYQKVLTILAHFKTVKLEHILRSSNSRADTLSKLALGKGRGHYDSVILLTVSQPSISVTESVTNEPKKLDGHLEVKTVDEMTVMAEEDDWRQPIREVIKRITDEDYVQDKSLAKKVARYG